MSVWSEVIIGFALVAGTYWIIRTAICWRQFRRSIHKEIYSGYFEYAFRKKNISRLSESFYFKNNFGKHRIFYQLAQAKNEKMPQAYVLVLLTSGLYILNVKNQGGRIIGKKNGDFKQYYTEKESKKQPAREHQYLLRNPLEESRFFEKRILERLDISQLPCQSVVVFPDNSELKWDGPAADEIPVIRRAELFGHLKSDFEKHPDRLTEDQVEKFYHILADESIALEKGR